MAYEGKFADAGKITGLNPDGSTFGYPGHHVLVRDLLNHPIYRDFFQKLSTTIDPSSIDPAAGGTGRLYYDVGNRIDNSINLQPSQGGDVEEMVKDLKEKVFPTKPVHFLAVNKDGKQVRVL